MVIRYGNIKDIEKINKLYEILFKDMANLQKEYIKESKQDESFIKMVIEKKDYDIFVSEENNEIVGFAIVQEMKTPPYNCIVEHNYSYVIDIVVSPSQRGRGIGNKLLNEIKNWSIKRKLDYIELNVLSNNISAIKLYENLGYEECSRIMRKKL